MNASNLNTGTGDPKNSDPGNKHPMYPVGAQGENLEASEGMRQGIYGKTLLLILLGMGLALAMIRVFAWSMDAGPTDFLGRVLEAKDALPQVVKEDKELVMVFGSSMVQAGFSPREFDQWAAERGYENIKSFNYGFGGLNPFYQEVLTRRIKDVFDENNRRLKVAVIEFNPFQTTITRYNRNRILEDSYLTILGTNAELWDIMLADPTRGFRLFNIKYLRNSISAEMATSFLGGSLREPRKRTELERDPERRERLDEVGDLLNQAFEEEYPDYVPSNWSYEWQGGGTIAAERKPETLAIFEEYYELIRDPARMDDARLNRIHTADIIDMHFSEELVVKFIDLVNQFKTFSDHVEVVMLPRNTKWITHSAAGAKRLRETVQRIEQATGVTIANHQDLPVIKPTMFSDATHLNRYQGAHNYTKYLVDYIEPHLRP
ncbi:hypothetical protein [Marinicella meishanensis]|uniref:hypothetical protein n=1 Tax=Marinicella meishanensis TaxID=2873263 RepID=UPI001CBB9E64|nr:hypothetical protein [Marinicella sp. NBU2979]